MKINYQQRYLDEELKNHVHELLGQLKEVASEDEGEDEKENLNGEIEYETDSDEENEKKDNNMDVV